MTGVLTSSAGDGARTERIALRLRIGITGHRQLADPDAVGARAREELAGIRTRFTGDADVPVTFSIVSALAEGSDRLVAIAALEVLEDHGVDLEVVLPRSRADYEADFASAASTDAFRQLLGRAATVTQVPHATSHDEGYELAGRYVVDRCDVLIAVWDGEPPRGRGGTGEIVDYARRSDVPVVVLAPDASASGAHKPGGEWAEPGSMRAARYRVAEYDRLSLESGRMARALRRERGVFAEVVGDSPLHWQAALVGEWALPHFVRADFLALKYQARYYHLGEALFGAAALAVTAVAAQYVFAPREPSWALIEVALMFSVLTVFLLGRRARVHDRWIGYRSLAEAVRGAPFIALTGFGGRTGGDEISSRIGGDEKWYQRMFTEVWRGRPTIAREHGDTHELARILSEGWLDRQIAYHRSAVDRYHRSGRTLTAAISALFAVTLLVGLLHVLEVGAEGAWPKIFVFMAIMLPGFGAALAGVRDQRQYRLHQERSRATADQLERLRRRMTAATSLRAIRKLAAEAQGVMTNENLDWSGVIEFQDLEMIV